MNHLRSIKYLDSILPKRHFAISLKHISPFALLARQQEDGLIGKHSDGLVHRE